MQHAITLAAILALAPLAACASQSPDPGSAAPSGTSTASLTPASASTPALDVLKAGGSFAFALDESAPAAFFHQKCASDSNGDAAAADACYAHVRDVSSHEGIRFAIDAQGHLVWTSYGLEDGKEAIYVEAPLAVTTEGDHVVVGTPAGAVHGLQVPSGQIPAGKTIRFEVVDARTVTMTDPQKGLLVFHKVS
jgi:hypothetical protein